MGHKGQIGTSMTSFRIPKSKRVTRKPCLACGRMGDTKKMVKRKAANGDPIYYHTGRCGEGR